MSYLNLKKVLPVISICILLLFLGFFLNEDLSTGGARMDFFDSFEAVKDYANFHFNSYSLHTRHFPLHYLILSIPHAIFENIQFTRYFYFIFGMQIPIFLYLNLNLLYPSNKVNNLLISFSILLFPYFRVSIIWANAHLTALLFLIISNYFFLKYKKNKIKENIFFNLLFLSFATYSIQSYAVFFIYYLNFYFKSLDKLKFFYILVICFIFSLPGFYLVLFTPLGGKLAFSGNLSYTILINSSIVFFFIIFFISNQKSFNTLKNQLQQFSYVELAVISILYLIFILSFQEPSTAVGGGFFYKISYFIFGNKYLFFLITYFAIITIYLIFKIDKELFFIMFLNNLTSIAYYTSQRYFEPLLVVTLLIFSINFLNKNLVYKTKNIFNFYIMALMYLIMAFINNSYRYSVNLPIN
jgi:hypothetical protein